jgi:ketosteroid isomerase-like protein
MSEIQKLWIEADKLGKYSWTPVDAGVAKSGDMAWSYSKYTANTGASASAQTGYVIHIWKRNAAGDWKLAVDVVRPDPPPQPPQ